MDYFETGFAVRKASWHAKETLLDTAPDTTTWRQAAGLEWEPVKIPLYLPSPIVAMNEDGSPVFGQARESGTFCLARSDRLDDLTADDLKVRDRAILSRGVSDEYEPIEHERDMTPLLEALEQAAGAMSIGHEFTTAGSVREGKQVYACLQLDRPIQPGGDESLTLPFLTLLNSHDGTGACRGGPTMVRVVCANTYAMTENDFDAHGLNFTVRHSGDVASRLEQARQAIAGMLDAIEQYETMATHLCSLPVSDEIVVEWVGEFLPIDEKRMPSTPPSSPPTTTRRRPTGSGATRSGSGRRRSSSSITCAPTARLTAT